MNYADIKQYDVANGLGIRVSLFVSGCTHHCKNCFNKETWDFRFGNPFTEAEIEKIKNVFLAILRDIKKDMDNREQPGEAVTAAMFQTMQETMKDHQQELLSMDDVTAMIAGQIGKFLPMDEETAEQFRQLAKRMMEQVGK